LLCNPEEVEKEVLITDAIIFRGRQAQGCQKRLDQSRQAVFRFTENDMAIIAKDLDGVRVVEKDVGQGRLSDTGWATYCNVSLGVVRK
jgi:hypothetical protein